MPAFKRLGGGVRLRLRDDEVALLRTLPDQLREALTGADAADPVVTRLFPPAYEDETDAEREEDYRRLMYDELLAAKLGDADLVRATLDRGAQVARRFTVDLSDDEATAWLGLLNDARLALGARLQVTEDFTGDVDEHDPNAPALYLLSYLGALEEDLLEALAS